jgi:hypothetical protein
VNTAHGVTVTIIEEAENIQFLFYNRPGYGHWHIIFDKDLCGVKKETFRITYKSAKKYFDMAVAKKRERKDMLDIQNM